jgi:hypothetical protein
MIGPSASLHGAGELSHALCFGSLHSSKVLESMNTGTVHHLPDDLYLASYHTKFAEVKNTVLFDLRLAQCRPYNLLSYARSAFCSKPASPNTPSWREPGSNPLHFDSDSPQDRKSSDLTLSIRLVVLQCPTANSKTTFKKI